jgi:Tfp pilus assembly protein PilF
MKSPATLMTILLVTIGFVIPLACGTEQRERQQDTDLANDYFEKAKESFDAEDYTKAVRLLDSALMYKEDHASSLATRASAYYNIGQYNQA